MKTSIFKDNIKSFSKQAVFAITLALLLAVSTSITAMQSVNAQVSTATYPTNAFITVSPNPAGVGQPVTVMMWLAQINPTATFSTGRWENFTVLDTNANGTTTTLGPFEANDASFAVTAITLDTVGNYTLKFTFPGQHVTGYNTFYQDVDITYAASSFTTTLTVQEQPATSTPQSSLPSNYWTRPVNSQNSFWYQISGNWLGMGYDVFGSNQGSTAYGTYQPYSEGPNSAHILWTKPLLFGGLIGGSFGGGATSNYYDGKSYQPQFNPPVIINGVLYYNAPTASYEGFYAVDLKTGETLWFQNSTGLENGGISFGQVYDYISPNQEGGIPYLWSTSATDPISGLVSPQSTWSTFDANTGNLILQVENTVTTGGTFTVGPNGELLYYMMGDDWVALWNASMCIQTASMAINGNQWQFYPPIGATIDFSTGIEWNVTVPAVPGQGIVHINSDVILATSGTTLFIPADYQINVGYSATTGEQLWVKNVTLPSGPATSFTYIMGPLANGIFTAYDSLARQYYGFSATTGEKVWGPTTANPNAWASESPFDQTAYGILYGLTAAGIDALNMTTGTLLWRFSGINSGIDFPGFTQYPFVYSTMSIADGKVYIQTGDSNGDPDFRGAQLYCVNATNGNLIWRINTFATGVTMPIADGVLAIENLYDNQLYAYAKGPSKLTVNAPSAGVTTATPITIAGTITDISSGAFQQTVAANYPNGLPCVSDDSMTGFMQAVYMQQPMPNYITGVPITISVVDSNGNFRQIGTTTSDGSGGFRFTWTPDIPGDFTVVANFAGSESYYPSSAEAFFTASAPAPTSPTATSAPASVVETYFVPAVIAIIIVIIVGFVALFLALRKHP